MNARRGNPGNPEGTERISFNVDKETYAYLTELITTSSIGGDQDKVAQHIFEAAMIEAEQTGKYEIERRAAKALEKSMLGSANVKDAGKKDSTEKG